MLLGTIAAVAVVVACGVTTGVFHVGRAHSQPQAALSASDGSVPMLGSSIKSMADLGPVTARFSRMPIVRVYYSGLPPSNAWTTGLAGANHSAVIVSFKALPTTILSGADDAALRQFFDTAPTGHPIYYSFYHEPEDNIAAGQFTLSDYKAAWGRVVSLADAAHNPNLHSTLILMEYDLDKVSGRDWKSYLPGGNIISTLGWDAYPTGSATNDHPQLQPPADFMGPAIAASKSVGLPYGFAEFGLSTPTGRPAWLTEVGKYLMTSGALFGTLFNGTGQYPTLQLTDQASINVWRGFVTESAAELGAPPAAPNSPSPAPSSSSPAPSPAPSSSSPAPAPSTSVPVAPPAPPASGGEISGLALSPAALTVTGANYTNVSFNLAQAANVTICILNDHSAVVRQLDKPSRRAGKITFDYYGYNGSGKSLPAGNYTVLVVASNAQGSSTAETSLTISSP